MDLAYLTGQRPADALKMTVHDMVDGHLIVTQEKTKQPLRIRLVGELATLLERIEARKAGHNVVTAALLVNEHGSGLPRRRCDHNLTKPRRLRRRRLQGWPRRLRNFVSMTFVRRRQTILLTAGAKKLPVTYWVMKAFELPSGTTCAAARS